MQQDAAIKQQHATTKIQSIIMEKTPRYTQRERNMVLGYAAQYKDVIENKRTDAESNRKKDEVWRNIAKEFNSRVYHQRTAKQLRQLYKNMKLLLKKDLNTDGRTESFMDILTALSAQSNMLTYGNKTNNFDRNSKRFNVDKNFSFGSTENIESDVVIIKSEDISDNEQSSLKNEMDDIDDDDSISNKDIPEVCLEEDDDDNNIFNPSNSSFSRLTTTQQNQLQQQQSYLTLHQQQQLQDIEDHKNIQQQNTLMGNGSDSLLSLAIEERKRKIELLNAQIDYWKMLTKKLEMSNSNNPITQAAVAGSNCPCHVGSPPAARVNGCNQS